MNFELELEIEAIGFVICQSVCLSVSQSVSPVKNLNIDRVKRFPKLTVALTL